jgi:hypothetical protein
VSRRLDPAWNPAGLGFMGSCADRKGSMLYGYRMRLLPTTYAHHTRGGCAADVRLVRLQDAAWDGETFILGSLSLWDERLSAGQHGDYHAYAC